MDLNFIKNYIGNLNSGELRDLMSYIDRESRGSEIVDSIKKVFDSGHILQLNFGSSSVYASKLIKSEYGVGNVRHFYFKLLNCGEVMVEVPNTIVDTFTKEKPYLDFSAAGGCKLFVEKDWIKQMNAVGSVSFLDSFALSELRVQSMVVARITTGEYNPFTTTIPIARTANMTPKAVADVTALKEEVEVQREKFETKNLEVSEADLEEADPKLQEADANEKRENFTFTSLANITSFVNSAKDTSVYVEYVNETNEEKTVNGCKHVIRRKNINSELYNAMKLEMVGTEPVIHFENDYGHAHMYHIHWDNERQEDYVQLLKTGIITVQVDKDIFLRLTLGKNSTPLSYNEVGDILYA